MSNGPKAPAPPSTEASNSLEKSKDSSGASTTPSAPSASRDLVVLNGPTPDGEGVRVVRLRVETVELGEMRALKEGAPITSGDVVQLHAREGSPLVWDVEVQYSAGRKTEKQHAGPARVSNALYRRNWDSIFGASEAEDDEAEEDSGKVRKVLN